MRAKVQPPPIRGIGVLPKRLHLNFVSAFIFSRPGRGKESGRHVELLVSSGGAEKELIVAVKVVIIIKVVNETG